MKYITEEKNTFPLVLNRTVIKTFGLIEACILHWIELSNDEKGMYVNVEFISDSLSGYTKSIITKALKRLEKENIIFQSFVEESPFRADEYFEYYKINYDILNTVMGWK